MSTWWTARLYGQSILQLSPDLHGMYPVNKIVNVNKTIRGQPQKTSLQNHLTSFLLLLLHQNHSWNSKKKRTNKLCTKSRIKGAWVVRRERSSSVTTFALSSNKMQQKNKQHKSTQKKNKKWTDHQSNPLIPPEQVGGRAHPLQQPSPSQPSQPHCHNLGLRLVFASDRNGVTITIFLSDNNIELNLSPPPARPVVLVVEVNRRNCREVFLRALPVQLRFII